VNRLTASLKYEAYNGDASERAIFAKQALEAAHTIVALRKELISEIRSELALAAAYCANKTTEHCMKRLAELESTDGT
jgi:hypothetical protein